MPRRSRRRGSARDARGRSPTPRCSHTASNTVCSTVRSGNRLLIWKVRASPHLTRWSGRMEVTRSPSRNTSPSLGGSMPVSRLISVVLPAPFGPMMACRAPRSSTSDTSVTARTPPKCLPSPDVRSAGVTVGKPVRGAVHATSGTRAGTRPARRRARTRRSQSETRRARIANTQGSATTSSTVRA